MIAYSVHPFVKVCNVRVLSCLNKAVLHKCFSVLCNSLLGRKAVTLEIGRKSYVAVHILNAVIFPSAIPFGILRKLCIPFCYYSGVAVSLSLLLGDCRGKLCSAGIAEFGSHGILLVTFRADSSFGNGCFGKLCTARGAEKLLLVRRLITVRTNLYVFAHLSCIALCSSFEVCKGSLKAR